MIWGFVSGLVVSKLLAGRNKTGIECNGDKVWLQRPARWRHHTGGD